MGGVVTWFQRLLFAAAAAAGLTTGMGCLAMFPCPEQLLDTWPVVATDIVDLEGAEIRAYDQSIRLVYARAGTTWEVRYLIAWDTGAPWDTAGLTW